MQNVRHILSRTYKSASHLHSQRIRMRIFWFHFRHPDKRDKHYWILFTTHRMMESVCCKALLDINHPVHLRHAPHLMGKNALFVRKRAIYAHSWNLLTQLSGKKAPCNKTCTSDKPDSRDDIECSLFVCLFVYWLIYCCRCLTESVYKFNEKNCQANECCRCVEASQWFMRGNLKNYFMFISFGCFMSSLVILTVIKIKSPTLQTKMKTKYQFQFIIALFKLILTVTAFAIPN